MKKNTIVSKTITPSTIRAANARLTNKDPSSRYTVVVVDNMRVRGKSSVRLAGDSWVIQSGNSNPRTVSSSALKAASRNSMKKNKVTSE